MDAVLLIADNDSYRRAELRQFFRENGFLTMAVSNSLDCKTALRALEPDVLVIAASIPWGGAKGVIAELDRGSGCPRAGRARPYVLVVGSGPVEKLAAETGVARCNCFPAPVRNEELLDRIGCLLAAGLLRVAQCWPPLPPRSARPRAARQRIGESAARQWRPTRIVSATSRAKHSLAYATAGD